MRHKHTNVEKLVIQIVQTGKIPVHTDAHSKPLLELLNTESNWKQSVTYAMNLHALTPYLVAIHRSPEKVTLNEKLRLEIDNLLSRERMWLAVLDQELELVLSLFSEVHIQVITLKGMDLGTRFYPDRILRSMTDIDLLVHKSHFPYALNVLEKAGFQVVGSRLKKRFRIELSRGKGHPIIELHSSLLVGYTNAMLKNIWTRSFEIPATKTSPSMRVMSAEDTLVYLIGHAAVQHLLESPVWLNDIHYLIKNSPTLDWNFILKNLKEAHHFVAGWFVLGILIEGWDTPIPIEVQKLIRSQMGVLKRKILSFSMSSSTWFLPQPKSFLAVIKYRILLRDNWYEAYKYAANRYLPKLPPITRF